MEKTQSQILKEMKGYKKRYKKFHFGESGTVFAIETEC